MNQARIRSGPIPVGSDSDATQSERKGKFRDMSTLDPRYLELLAAQARAKFSDKIDAIGKKYGAYEYIVSDDQLVRTRSPLTFRCLTKRVHLSRKY